MGYQCDGRTAYRVMRGGHGKTVFAHAAGRCTGGPDLPVQPQQPHRRGVQPGSIGLAWVDYANERGAVLLFDAAYARASSRTGTCPASIYEVNGAETCAIEFCSFSKTAGFTGTRCSYTVPPQALVRGSLHLTPAMAAPPDHEIQRRTVHCAAGGCGRVHGGGAKPPEQPSTTTGPMLPSSRPRWTRRPAYGTAEAKQPLYLDAVPGGMKSWDFFDHLLEHAGVGSRARLWRQGEGYFRLTGFGDAEKTRLAAQKLKGSAGAVGRRINKNSKNNCSGSVSAAHLFISAHRRPYQPTVCRRQTAVRCGYPPGKQADASAQDHRHDRELVNVDEVKNAIIRRATRAAAHPDIPPGARFQAAYRLCRVLGRKTAFASGGGQKLRIYASRYLEGNNETCPTGKILPVAGTPMDFRAGKPIGRDIDTGFSQTTMVGGGYDHCYVIDSGHAVPARASAHGLPVIRPASACLAQDVAQGDFFAGRTQIRCSWRGTDSEKAWLMRIAVNRCKTSCAPSGSAGRRSCRSRPGRTRTRRRIHIWR